MSGSTSVPAITFGPLGPVAPAESALVAGLDADWNAAFGGNLNTAPTTRAGQLIASQAAIIGDSNNAQVTLYQGVDPAYADGRMQDAIARIYFLERNPAQSTVLQVTCGGGVGVIIPVGALIQDPTGAIYSCTTAGTIPSGGSITLPFASQVMAPIPVPGSAVIYQSVFGWDTVSVISGVVGNLAEGRAAFEARREATVAANGAGFLPAIAGAIAVVPGVIDYYVTSNDTAAPVTTGGVTIGANSLYAAVSGGLAADIAQAIWTKKNPGCAYTGGTSVTVYDSNSGYSMPYPSYTVKFDVATDVTIFFNVILQNNASVPANVAALVQAAIMNAFIGGDGGPRARIGSTIYVSRFYAAVASLGSWVEILAITIGNSNTVAASVTASIATTTMTVTAIGSGALAAGQPIYGVNVTPDTFIEAQITGSPGSTGTYRVAPSQTAASATVNALAMGNSLAMQINQEPVAASAAINVMLV